MTQEIDHAEMQRELIRMGERARAAGLQLGAMSAADKVKCLEAMAQALEDHTDDILAANAVDLENGRKQALSKAMLDRLALNPARVDAMAKGLREVAAQRDPVGRILSQVTRPNGLVIEKRSVPIGVIGIIYEARPNVTVDAAGICLKAGNAVILRGGKESVEANRLLARLLDDAGCSAGMPEGAVQLIPWIDRAAVGMLLKMSEYIDLIIPRGGESLIRAVVEQSTIPVIKHYKGVCHLYADASCDISSAVRIIENAKCQRPGTCNALETLLIDRAVAPKLVGPLMERLRARGVEVRGDEAFRALVPEAKPATEDDYYAEYLDLILSVRIVDGVRAAVEHINQYGSRHSDGILSETPEHIEWFFNYVDSSTLYCNASTRFTDGGEFGMGAEIGISTDKLHARGPMGVDELVTYKYIVRGAGQIRE